MEVLKSLQPEKWQRSQIVEELEHALAAIDDAEDDFVKSSRRLQSLRPTEDSAATPVVVERAAPPAPETPQELMKRGFALSLPLIVSLFVLMLAAKFMF